MATEMDSVNSIPKNAILCWVTVVALWLAIYVGAIATVAAFVIVFMIYQGSVSEHPFNSWHIPIAIMAVLIGVTAALRALWPRIVFTEEKFSDVAREWGARLSSVGRVRIAGFGAVEVGYYFHRGFVSFPVDWKPPAFQSKRQWVEEELKKNDGWIKAWHLWSIMKLVTPLVIRLSAEMVDNDKVERARRALESALDGRRVEVWLQRYQDGGAWMRYVTSEEGCNADQSDDVFLFAYSAPWESARIRAGIRIAAELGQQEPQGRLCGPGWFAG